MEVEAEVGVDADPEVVVHDEDGGGVFVGVGRVGVVGDGHLRLVRFLLVRVKYYRPPGGGRRESVSEID